MFYPVGRECRLRLEGEDDSIVYLSGNRERTYIAALSSANLYIYQNQPQVLLSVFKRSKTEVEERGEFVRVYWQFDAAAVACTTTKAHLLIFGVNYDPDYGCYQLSDAHDVQSHKPSRILLTGEAQPSVHLHLSVVVNLVAPATCAVSLRDELFVCGQNGFSHHLQWNGKVDNAYSFQLAKIPFAVDQLQSKPEYLPDNSAIFVRDCVYAPLIGGFCLVLSDGRSALLTSTDPRFHPNSLLGVWAGQLRDAVCTDVNHKFRLLLFGCQNGDVAAYHLDDQSGALVQTFRVSLSVRDGPEVCNRMGAVRRVQVLPQGGAFAVVWDSWRAKENGVNGESRHVSTSSIPPALAIFSPFGSQIWSSLEGSFEKEGALVSYTSVEWGNEGMCLWLGRTDGASSLQVARAAAFNNPYMEHSSRVVLLCYSRVLVSPDRAREASASAPHSVWNSIDLSQEYIRMNWPIRFVTLDREESKILVVAGLRGLSYCSLANGRWKIFGNESQERDMLVTGGVFVWRGMIGACADDKIRLLPMESKLDTRYASSRDAETRIIMCNLRGDCLVTLDIDSRLLLYSLRRIDKEGDRDGYAKAEIERSAEIRISDLIPHPACLVSVHLTMLNHDKASPTFVPGIDTVLVNISGKLITLNPKFAAKDDQEENRFQLNQPMMVASFVENVWHDQATISSPNSKKDRQQERNAQPTHLQNALWLNCGSKGMRVWLALFPSKRNAVVAPQESFISKRIMLPFSLENSPMLICSDDCVATGVESTPTPYSDTLTIHSVHRNSEVFVHHLLRQLLKRNLGVFALDIAESCRNLPYFTHALELLLHNVLEEEATSSEPIPDPLLPRAVDFIHQFPEFLRTVAHCARKTELALWPELFAVTGTPNDLFELCLRDGELETASSYLIILQNIESPLTSQEQCARLLRDALSAGDWPLVSDLIRFARSIDNEDLENPTAKSPPPNSNKDRRTKRSGTVTENADELVFARFQAGKISSRMRHSHSISEAPNRKDSGGGRKLAKAQSNEISPPSPTTVSNPLYDKLQMILHEHAMRLLEDYCIRDLGFLCAHLEVDAPGLLSSLACSSFSSSSDSLLIHDFPKALTRVHSQFAWPYPVASSKVVDQLAKRFARIRESNSAVCLSGDIPSSSASPSLRSAPINNNNNNGPSSSRRSSSENTPTNGEEESDAISIQVAQLIPVEKRKESDSGLDHRSDSPGGSSFQTPSTPLDDARSLNGGTIHDRNGTPLMSEVANASDAQLRHMIDVFGEINAIDWIFLLCVVLRDASVARARLSVAAGKKVGAPAIRRLRDAARQLSEWASTNCVGYVHVLHVFYAHLTMVVEALDNSASTPSSPVDKVPPSLPTPAPLRKPPLGPPPPRARGLRDSFGAPPRTRVRDRSRSVDRGTEEVVSNVQVQESECSIM